MYQRCECPLHTHNQSIELKEYHSDDNQALSTNDHHQLIKPASLAIPKFSQIYYHVRIFLNVVELKYKVTFTPHQPKLWPIPKPAELCRPFLCRL